MGIEGDRYQSGLFSPGDQLSASKLNELAALASRGLQYHSSGSQTIQGSFGTVTMSQSDIPTDGAYDYPFKVTVSNGEGNEKKVTVRPGTVNNFVPKIGGVYLDAPTAPTLNFSTVSGYGVKYVALKVTKSGATFFPNTFEVVLLDTPGVDTDNDGYITLASIACSNVGGVLYVVNVSQFIYASQMVARVKPTGATAVWSFSSR